jgi:hypothetical protein
MRNWSSRMVPTIPTITAFEQSPDRGQGLARDMTSPLDSAMASGSMERSVLAIC